MWRGLVALVVVLMLGAVGAMAAFADTELCVTEDLGRCMDNVPRDEAAAELPVQDSLAVVEIAVETEAVVPEDAVAEPAEQPQVAPSTRTIGPPSVVNPFAATAAPAAVQVDDVTRFNPPSDRQRLPPGPPNRLP